MIKAKASKLSLVLFSALVLFGILTYTIVNANHAQSLSADTSSAQSGGGIAEQAGSYQTDESNETSSPQTVREIAEQTSAAQAEDSAANAGGTPDDRALSQSVSATSSPSSAASAASVSSVSSTSKDESADNAAVIASIAKQAIDSVNETSNKQSAIQAPASPAAPVANAPQASDKDKESSAIPDKSVSIAGGASSPPQAASGATENVSAAAPVESGTVSGKETHLPEKAAVKSITFVDAAKQKPVTVEKSKPVVQASTATVASAPSATYSSPAYSAPSPAVQEPSAPAEEEYCEEEEC